MNSLELKQTVPKAREFCSRKILHCEGFRFMHHLARGRQWGATTLYLGTTVVPSVHKTFATGCEVSVPGLSE